jgi:hypothetical protein
VLDQQAVAEPEDVDELELDPVPGRRQVPELAEMGAAECLAGRHEIALGELVTDFHGGIGKALQQRAVKGLESARGPVRLRDITAFRPVMVLEFRVEGLVGERQVVLVLAALYELGHRTLVVVIFGTGMIDAATRHSPTSRIRHPSCIICRHGR